MNDETRAALLSIRNRIDRLDHQLVSLLCERQALVQRASRLKSDEDAVRAPERVEEIITRVRTLAEQKGASPDIVEIVYRTMIESYIKYELREHRSLNHQSDEH